MVLMAGNRAPVLDREDNRRRFADRLAVAILVLLTGLVAATFRQYGATFDEAVQDSYGRYILDWYVTLGGDRNAVTYLDLFYYGGLFDTLAALANKISPFGHYETRHLLNALAGILGLAGCWRLGRRLGGPVAGMLSLCLLALMASWYGMMFVNPKDIPFAAAMVWGTVLLTDITERPEKPPLRSTLTLALIIGLALGIRIGALLLPIYLGCLLTAAAMRRWNDAWRVAMMALARMTLTTFLPVMLVAWAVMLAFWPFAQLDPIGNPLLALRHFAGLSTDIPTLYFGAEIGSAYHPRFYLPVYIVVKLPDVVVAALVAAVVLVAARLWAGQWPKPGLRFLPLLLSVAVPIAYVVATDPELYDAERHFLFLLPPLAVIASLALDELYRLAYRPLLRTALTAAVALGVLVQVTEMIRLHPYEYVFFNDLVGGVTGAAGRFETEYWGEALTEAADGLAARLDPRAPPGSVPVLICGEPHSLVERLPPSVHIVDSKTEARYYLSTTRDHCDAAVPGRELLRVQREGVPFAVVKDVAPLLAHAPGAPAGS